MFPYAHIVDKHDYFFRQKYTSTNAQRRYNNELTTSLQDAARKNEKSMRKSYRHIYNGFLKQIDSNLDSLSKEFTIDTQGFLIF